MDGRVTLRQRLERFFFARQVPYGMALVRICLSLVTLFYMGRRFPYVRELYSTDGAPAPLADNYGYFEFLPLLSGSLAVAFYTLMLLMLVALLVGWKSRIAASCVFVLFTYFTMQDALSTMTKHSVLCSHGFLLLAISRCGAVWSVDRYLALKRQGLKQPIRLLGTGEAVEVWPQRLMQLFLGFVYFGAAITKLKTPTYFSGDQLRLWLLTNMNHYNPIGELMSAVPAMLVLFGYIAIIWEILFLFTVWNRTARLPVLLLGGLFHIMTTITLGLYIFPLVCISLYLCFFTEEDLAWWQRVGNRASARLNFMGSLTRVPHRLSLRIARGCEWLGNYGFVTGMASVLMLVVVVEHSLDGPYFRWSGEPYRLTEIPTEEVQRLLRTDTRIEEEDKLLSFDLGEWMVSGLVTQFSRTFEPGDLVYAQANVIPPHGDMYLQCDLHDVDGSILDQSDGILQRDSFRYTFQYKIPESLPAGEYQFVLKSNMKEIARKTFTIQGPAADGNQVAVK